MGQNDQYIVKNGQTEGQKWLIWVQIFFLAQSTSIGAINGGFGVENGGFGIQK